MRNCARSRSGCAICASWRSGATAILKSMREQGKLDAELEPRSAPPTARAGSRTSICPTSPSAAPRRRSPREAGLEPLADVLLADPQNDPRRPRPRLCRCREGRRRRQRGARRRARHPGGALRRGCRPDRLRCARQLWTQGPPRLQGARRQEAEGAKFADYFDFSEPLSKLPSHRILALFRGEKEEVLDLAIEPESTATASPAARAPTSCASCTASTSRTGAGRPTSG